MGSAARGWQAQRRSLLALYRRLRHAYGHARWWPGQSPFEVCVGALLAQNTAWINVERSLDVLRRHHLLSVGALGALTERQLAALIRPSGTYNVKARRLAALVAFLHAECGGRVEALRRFDLPTLRLKLLNINGIGPETADAILLYAAEKPVFVVDAYTRRIFSRLGLVPPRGTYAALQEFFMQRLPPDVGLFNDYHAQIVRLAKEACRSRPRCERCPLEDRCPRRGVPRPA